MVDLVYCFISQAEERLAMIEEQRKIDEVKQKLKKEQEKRVKEEQKKILGKNNSRPKLSFSLKPLSWVIIVYLTLLNVLCLAAGLWKFSTVKLLGLKK